jgi:hypothetical protein
MIPTPLHEHDGRRKIAKVYAHDCCGRGPYLAVVMDQPIPEL